MPRRGTFEWDDGRARYLDASGHVVDPIEIRKAIDVSLDKSAERVRRLATDLQRGAISAIEWEIEMQKAVKSIHLYSMAAAAGGWKNITATHYSRLGPILREQYKRLRRFGAGLHTGSIKPDGRFLRRADLYAQAGRGTYHRFERIEQERVGYDEERNLLGAADHCGDCVEQAGRGWVKIGALVPIGARQCLGNCRCFIEYRRSQGDPPNDEPAPTPEDKKADQTVDYRRFVDRAAADRWGRRGFETWARDVGWDERDALQFYRDKDFVLLNGIARGLDDDALTALVKKGKAGAAERVRYARQMAPLLDGALGSAELPEDVVVYRGIRSKEVARLARAGELVGQTITDDAWASTSLLEEETRRFVGKGRSGILLEIRAKKGLSAAYLDAVDLPSASLGEAEVLFGRRTGFRVLEVQEGPDGTLRVIAEATQSAELPPLPVPAPKPKTLEERVADAIDELRAAHLAGTARSGPTHDARVAPFRKKLAKLMQQAHPDIEAEWRQQALAVRKAIIASPTRTEYARAVKDALLDTPEMQGRHVSDFWSDLEGQSYPGVYSEGVATWQGTTGFSPRVSSSLDIELRNGKDPSRVWPTRFLGTAARSGTNTVVHEYLHVRSGIRAGFAASEEYQSPAGRWMEESLVEYQSRQITLRAYLDEEKAVESFAHYSGAYDDEVFSLAYLVEREGTELVGDIFHASSTLERAEIWGSAIRRALVERLEEDAAHAAQAIESLSKFDTKEARDAIFAARSAQNEFKEALSTLAARSPAEIGLEVHRLYDPFNRGYNTMRTSGYADGIKRLDALRRVLPWL